MHKLSCLVFLCFCNTILFSQKTDSLNISYRSGEFSLSRESRRALDQFLSAAWDKITIRSYADVSNEDDYNMNLSRNRANEVYKYLLSRQMPSNNITMEYFGESVLLADNQTEEGRAINRRTTVTGLRYARISHKPGADPNIPVTQTLQNGFIITYRPKNLSAELLEEFEKGWGSNIEVITNTREMRNANLFNNTTDGEILSSVLIFSGEKISNCKLDSPVFLKAPIRYTECPMDSIRFFVAVQEGGKRIWQEKIMQLVPETIEGQRYLGVWIDNFCGTYNFDFKVRPGDCFNIDSVGLITMKNNIRNISSELVGLNSVYLPRQLGDSLFSIWFVKDAFANANVSFTLYNGKRVLKKFYNQPLSSFPYSKESKSYVLTTDTIRFQSEGVKDFFMLLKVNRDVYRIVPEKNAVEFVYLNRHSENIRVDIYAAGKRKKMLEFKNVPIESIPFDPLSGSYVINKELLQKLEASGREYSKHLTMK